MTQIRLDKKLYLNILAPDSTVLFAEEGVNFSAQRTIDYANDRLDACVFYTSSETDVLGPGVYRVEILEESVVIGTAEIDLR